MADFPDPVTLTSNLVYTLSITNRGVSVAPGVIVTDTLPNTANFISALSSQGSCSVTGNVVSCSLGSIGGANSVQINITIAPTALETIASWIASHTQPRPRP